MLSAIPNGLDADLHAFLAHGLILPLPGKAGPRVLRVRSLAGATTHSTTGRHPYAPAPRTHRRLGNPTPSLPRRALPILAALTLDSQGAGHPDDHGSKPGLSSGENGRY